MSHRRLNQRNFDKTENWESLLMYLFGPCGRQGKNDRKLDTHHFSLTGKLKQSLPWETHLSVVAPSIDKTFSALRSD